MLKKVVRIVNRAFGPPKWVKMKLRSGEYKEVKRVRKVEKIEEIKVEEVKVEEIKVEKVKEVLSTRGLMRELEPLKSFYDKNIFQVLQCV